MRSRPRRLLATLAIAGLTVAGCSDADLNPQDSSNPSTTASVPDSGVTGSGSDEIGPDQLAASADPNTNSDSGATDTSAGSPGPASRPESSTDASPIGELEEPPADESESFTERLKASDYLESTATAAEVDAAAKTSCQALVVAIVNTHQDLLNELGDAGRQDSAAVDTAFEQFGMNGVLISRQAQELGCEDGLVDELVCHSVDQLQPQGDVGDDLVAILSDGCP